MQPKIIENFISKDTCKYINDYFVNNIKLDGQGYANINMSEFLPIYDENYLFKTLKKKDANEALFYDTLNLIMESMKAKFNYPKDDLGIELFNYRNFGQGQNFKEYHIDDYGQGGTLLTALLYLTDEYEGGEIVFYDGDFPSTENPITYRPQAGTLFYFRGIDPHLVNPVTSGRRALFSMNLRTPPATQTIKY